MDVFDEELLRFWKIANKLHLKYIMIEGVATNLHGYQRTTEDIDIWIENSNFDTVLKSSSIATIYGINIPFLHINDLIHTKKAANRPKDQQDIIELEKIRKILEDEQQGLN